MADTSEQDYTKLKVAELKSELKKRGLSTEGKKSDLIERLQLSSNDSALLDDTQDDLLDDDVLSDEVLEDDPVLDTPSITTVSAKRPAEELAKQHPKKIILNRKVVKTPDPMPEPVAVSESATPELSATEPAVAVAKVTVLSQKERLEKRAARFGGAAAQVTKIGDVAAPATKIEGAEVPQDPKPIRSNISAITMSSTTPATVPKTTSLDVLKRRAERFGTVAPILEKVELEERKRKRMERFGSGVTLTTTTTTTESQPLDKKVERAERFRIKT